MKAFSVALFLIAGSLLAAHIELATSAPLSSVQLQKSCNSSVRLCAKEKPDDRNLGDTMWKDCGQSSDIGKLLSVSISPDSPTVGDTLTITAKTVLAKDVLGGTVRVSIQYLGYIPVFNKVYPICSATELYQNSCPWTSGIHEATIGHTIPEDAPSGNYVGKAIAKDSDGNNIICVSVDLSL